MHFNIFFIQHLTPGRPGTLSSHAYPVPGDFLHIGELRATFATVIHISAVYIDELTIQLNFSVSDLDSLHSPDDLKWTQIQIMAGNML